MDEQLLQNLLSGDDSKSVLMKCKNLLLPVFQLLSFLSFISVRIDEDYEWAELLQIYC